MSTKEYMESYVGRMKNNHDVLMKLAEELKNRGCSVYSTRWRSFKQDGYRDYILAIKDGKWVYVGFHEVPYGWYADPDGSARNLRQVGNGYDFPFTIDEVMERMQYRNKKVGWFYEKL